MTENQPSNGTPEKNSTRQAESIFNRSARMCLGPCKRVKKGDQFTLRGDGVCDECAEVIRQEERELAKQNRAAALMDEMLVEVGSKEGLPKIEDLIGGIVGSFGGLNGFIKYYKDSLDAVKDRKTGPTIGFLNHLGNIMKLVMMANQHNRQERADQMSFDQIEREQKMMMFQMVVEAAKDDATADKLKGFLQDAGLMDFDPDEPAVEESQE